MKKRYVFIWMFEWLNYKEIVLLKKCDYTMNAIFGVLIVDVMFKK